MGEVFHFEDCDKYHFPGTYYEKYTPAKQDKDKVPSAKCAVFFKSIRLKNLMNFITAKFPLANLHAFYVGHCRNFSKTLRPSIALHWIGGPSMPLKLF